MQTKWKNLLINLFINLFNLFSRCTDCGFKKFATIDEEELSHLLESLI